MNDKMNEKNRRKHIRVPLLMESCAWTEYVGTHTVDRQAYMKDITIGGTFLKSEYLPTPGTTIMIRFDMLGQLGSINLKGRVVRLRWIVNKKFDEPKGFGVEFTEVSEANIKIMDAYITYLRNRQIILISKRILTEFFGEKGPFKP